MNRPGGYKRALLPSVGANYGRIAQIQKRGQRSQRARAIGVDLLLDGQHVDGREIASAASCGSI